MSVDSLFLTGNAQDEPGDLDMETARARLRDEARIALAHDSSAWAGALAGAFRELMEPDIPALRPVRVRPKPDRRRTHLR